MKIYVYSPKHGILWLHEICKGYWVMPWFTCGTIYKLMWIELVGFITKNDENIYTQYANNIHHLQSNFAFPFVHYYIVYISVLVAKEAAFLGLWNKVTPLSHKLIDSCLYNKQIPFKLHHFIHPLQWLMFGSFYRDLISFQDGCLPEQWPDCPVGNDHLSEEVYC